MFRSRIYVVSATLCCLAILAQANVTTEPPATIDLQTTTPSTTTEPTTTVKPNTTTEKPTTTTEEPTTTEKPTTTSEKPTTTTPPPTPKPAPTPAPAPTPLPPPEQGTWFYSENNVTCVVVQFAAQLNVTYTKAVNNTTSLANLVLNVPANATVSSGSCDPAALDQWLTVSWAVDNTTLNNMTLVFHKNDTTQNYMLKNLNVSLTAEIFPNASSPGPIVLSHGSEWQTPLATSYRCGSLQLNMSSEAGEAVSLSLARLQEQAFRSTPGTGFSAARECGGGDVPDAVPIAVGCALVGLVVVVLVAYLVGRRRSQARGYLSM